MDGETQIMESGGNERTSVNGSENETLPIAAYKCDFVNDEKDDYMEVWVVWMEGIVQIAVACLGLAGNSLAIPVLMSSKLNSIFNKILVFLTVFDNIFISCSLVEAIRTNVMAGPMGDIYIYLYAHFIFQFQSIAIVSSIFTTVILALERFLAVSKPIEYHNATQGMNPWSRVIKYVIPVMLLSAIFSIPKFFETKVVMTHKLYFSNGTSTYVNSTFASNSTSGNILSSPEVWASDLRLDEDYVFYYNNLAKLIVTGLLPFLSLSFFNFKIYAKIRSRRSSTGPAVVSVEHQQQINEENRQALVLFGIVIMFLLTNTPRILINMDEVFNIKKYRMDMENNCRLPTWILTMGRISQLLLLINSSINFFIYCLMSPLFREVFRSTFKRKTDGGVRVWAEHIGQVNLRLVDILNPSQLRNTT